MKIQMIETAQTASNSLSIGAFYIKSNLERQGHVVDVHAAPVAGYDAECVSVHHVTDFQRVAAMPKRSPLRILGGHAFYTNPRPLIPFADYLCLGEWDSGDLFAPHPSRIERQTWTPGSPLPAARQEETLPELLPYLNYEETGSAAYYLEIARGCPFACAYCELGHAIPYRIYPLAAIQAALDRCDFSKTRKVNLFAPDEASHPQYADIIDYLLTKGAYPSGFASMRVDTSKKLTALRKNMLIRCGIDGLTEATRFRVGKRLTDAMIVEHFQRLLDEGHTNFKMFMMFGYEWETLEDFREFERLMRRIFALDLKKNVSLRIKWTPLIPQPCTPLAATTPKYDNAMVALIQRWHLLYARPKRQPGWYIENDGLMSKRTHQQQCELTTATEEYFL